MRKTELTIRHLDSFAACSSGILYKFGTISLSGIPLSNERHYSPEALTDDLIQLLRLEENSTRVFLCASTSKSQKTVEDWLESLGFHGTQREENLRHPNHPLRFWVISVRQLKENLGMKS